MTIGLPGGELTVVQARGAAPDPAYTPAPEPVSWPGHDGETAHGFLYRPTHPDVSAPAGELPPLIVTAHGGPTSAAVAVPRHSISFFTSRGLAVLDVNYAGLDGLRPRLP